jgi:hypothetical protein
MQPTRVIDVDEIASLIARIPRTMVLASIALYFANLNVLAIWLNTESSGFFCAKKPTKLYV